MNTALILVFAYAFNEEGDVESKQYSKHQKVVLMKSSIYPFVSSCKDFTIQVPGNCGNLSIYCVLNKVVKAQ